MFCCFSSNKKPQLPNRNEAFRTKKIDGMLKEQITINLSEHLVFEFKDKIWNEKNKKNISVNNQQLQKLQKLINQHKKECQNLSIFKKQYQDKKVQLEKQLQQLEIQQQKTKIYCSVLQQMKLKQISQIYQKIDAIPI